MIDRIYKFIQTVSNKELTGNISPQEYRLLLNNSVEELYESNLQQAKSLTKTEIRHGRVFSIENVPLRFREKIMHFYKKGISVKTGNVFPLPADVRYLDSVESLGVELEGMQNRKHFKAVLNFIDTAPTLLNPIFLKIANELDVAPATILAPLDIYYLRAPINANWTYSVVNGTELYNPDASDFRNVDIHPSDEFNLTILILQKLGINLKEPDLAQYGLIKEKDDFQKDSINNGDN